MEDKLVLFNGPIIESVYEAQKQKGWFFKWWRFRRLKKKISTLSPDFNMLYAIAEFVRSLEIIYNYPNNEYCKMYSLNSKSKESSMNLFINVTNGYIEYQLSYPNIITVKMHRNTGNKLMSQWRFADGECELVNKETEMLMEIIIKSTMDAFLDLYENYYLGYYTDNPDHYGDI